MVIKFRKKSRKKPIAMAVPAGKLKASDYKNKRITGTEQEYGIWSSGNSRSFNHEHSGFLFNGGRIYEDCGHPEYASPESSNPMDAVRYSKAGETIVRDFVKDSKDYDFFKHVSDGRDHKGENGSFGAHESYSMKKINWGSFIEQTLAFFTTRMIYAGAGGIFNGKYEISQKARSINQNYCSRTTSDKSIINTKNESHSNKYERFHLTSGDANMSEIAEYLKLGTTALVLDLYEDGKLKNPPRFNRTLDSFHSISLDPKLKQKYQTCDGEMSAIEVQKYYQEAAKKIYMGRDKMTDDILNRWKFVLDSLRSKSSKKSEILDRWLDWRIKKRLIDSYMNKTGKLLNDVAVRNIDLMYHNIDKNKGLFYMLQSRGLVGRILTDKQIKPAINNAPTDTRAWIRGKAKKAGREVGWSEIRTKKGLEYMGDPFNKYAGLARKL